MTQSVINDGMQIFDALQESLHAANNEILVVAAWFTDGELLETLISKAKQGISVTTIISQNRDNEKLDFKKLTQAGGKVVWVKPKGYGILHNKFCIIDKKLVFHGSYNWTINAKKNNSESVIKSDHQPTIDALLEEFGDLMLKNGQTTPKMEDHNSKSIMGKLIKKVLKKAGREERTDSLPKPTDTVENNPNQVIKTATSDVDEIFQSIISSELKKTNREEIKERAYNQAKEVSGDAEVIEKSMDSLYHLFISDRTENTEKKNRLLQKIDKKVEDLSQGIITRKDERNHSIEIENQAIEKDLEIQKTNLQGKTKSIENQIDFINKTTIYDLEKGIEKEKEDIKQWDVAYVKPRWKWHEFIPLLLILSGLLVAMFLFYSSSAYIMLYSMEDARFQLSNGLDANPQVFQANAISRAFNKSTIAGIYILAFVFIPLAIAYITHFGSSKDEEANLTTGWKQKGMQFLKKSPGYLVVILLDAFIAFKVADTIKDIKFLTSGIRSEESVYTDINFWLVFFLGAIPFFFLAAILQKFLNVLGERNVQAGKEKMLVMKKHALKRIEELDEKIKTQKEAVHLLEEQIQDTENQAKEVQQRITFLPKELDAKIKQNNENTFNHLQLIQKKADLYKNDIENDNIQISMSSLKDRVSAFIEGWNEWLHDEFAVSKAVELSKEAMNKSDAWLEANLKKIDL